MPDRDLRQLTRLRRYTKLILIISVIGYLMSALVAVHGHFTRFQSAFTDAWCMSKLHGQLLAIASIFAVPFLKEKPNLFISG
jgi:hypothetical protein